MTAAELWAYANREKRQWLTAEEFLAQVQRHRTAKLNENPAPFKPFVPGPFVRTYVLNHNLKFTPRAKVMVTVKPEVTP